MNSSDHWRPPGAGPGQLPLRDRLPRRAIAGPAGDAEDVAVGERLAAGVDVGVEPGPDQVALAGGVPVAEGDVAAAGDLPALDAPLAGQPGQLGGFLVGGGQQQRGLALRGVGQPQVDRAVVDAVLRPVVDPPVRPVPVPRGQFSGAQLEACLALPALGEPADLGQLVPLALGRDQPEHAAGLDRAELLGVAGQDHPRARPVGQVDDPG